MWKLRTTTVLLTVNGSLKSLLKINATMHSVHLAPNIQISLITTPCFVTESCKYSISMQMTDPYERKPHVAMKQMYSTNFRRHKLQNGK